MSGLQALFGAEAARLLRTGWGDKIYEYKGVDERTGKPKYRPRDTGVQPLADEMYAILMSRKPLETWEPITIVNNGKGPALNIINTDPDAPAINIVNQITNPPPEGGITNLGDIQNLYDNSVSIGPGTITINEGPTNVTLSPTIVQEITQQINQTIINIIGDPVGDDDKCNRVVRPFQMTGFVQEGQTVLANILVWGGSGWVPGEPFTLATDFFTGAYLKDNRGLAQWDCKSSRFYLTGAGHTYFRGKLNNQLTSGGLATMRIEGSSPPQDITLHEVFGLKSPLAGETKIAATWNKVLKQWEGTVAAC